MSVEFQSEIIAPDTIECCFKEITKDLQITVHCSLPCNILIQ